MGSARGGDEAALVDLIAGRVDRLYAIASRIIRDPDRAQDALHEALVVAWRQLPSWRGCGSTVAPDRVVPG